MVGFSFSVLCVRYPQVKISYVMGGSSRLYYEYDIMWRPERLGRSLSKLVAGTGDLPDVREGEADRSLEMQRICHVATMPLDRLEAKHLDLLIPPQAIARDCLIPPQAIAAFNRRGAVRFDD